MAFVRQETDNWRREVPGARWFKADLHIHTIDDISGDRAKMPTGVSGDPKSPEVLEAYARLFLQGAVERGVRVLGLTPHSPRVGTDAQTSAVWKIVEEWNTGIDDDGKPFREKIYAVFPGFEPALKQGKKGLHLLFLFDPEIGRDNYLKAFDLVMGGVQPWRNNTLEVSNKDAEEACDELRTFHDRECPENGDERDQWRYIVLAPHIEAEKGLIGALQAQILELFEHTAVTGLELGDNKLPEDTLQNRPWLSDGMATNYQAFFHSSDAYVIDDIGKRYTWMKLASPRIEALRQAFIASDSRVRIAYKKDDKEDLVPIPNSPDPEIAANQRPWLKCVEVNGSASFFGVVGSGKAKNRFELSPDLTCIIGGSMTGKSTFFDGLRVYIDAPLPQDSNLNDQVEARGKQRFLGGSPQVHLECPGQDRTAPHHEQWPAVFYTQNELQRMTQEPEAIENILARLVASETQDIEDREQRLSTLGKDLTREVQRLENLDENLADAEQAHQRSKKAVKELVAFSNAGIEELHQVSSDRSRWKALKRVVGERVGEIGRVLASVEADDPPEINENLVGILRDRGVDQSEKKVRALWSRAQEALRTAMDAWRDMESATHSITTALEAHEETVRVRVNRTLADQGMDGNRINEFQALSRQAEMLASYAANLQQVRKDRDAAQFSFDSILNERKSLVEEQRQAFDRVIATIQEQFAGKISARRIDHGYSKPLEDFVKDLRQKGVTRWWNDLDVAQRPSPQKLLNELDAGRLDAFGMSDAVQETFREVLSVSKRRKLAALRCRDRYILERKLDDGINRNLDDLSGGQRVSVLLSLLLETHDNRPLVIDQPEDELDNRSLFEMVLPALKRLKGHRQIIVATHNANIVVNGDADQVILLEADANRGWIACAGAIEEPGIRDAIVRTVDGGDEAFRLRRLKYGF